MGTPMPLDIPFMIARYTNDAFMGLQHTAADTANRALTNPNAAIPTEQSQMGPSHDWSLGYGQPGEGLYVWNNGWQFVGQPANVSAVFNHIQANGGGTLHWFVYRA